MINTCIIYEVDGVRVSYPCEGARLANSVLFIDGEEVVFETPQPVDSARYKWPIDGAIVEWAETEAAFVSRTAAVVVPEGVEFFVVPVSSIPTDRSNRNNWSIVDGAIRA